MSDDPFVTHRSLLFTVAYEMLGSAADAEDVVQEAWLRWADVERSGVRDPRAYLVRIVTRGALDRLRTLSRRREAYVGEWLPEPLLTGPDVAEDVELAESVSIAMLTVLETLGPAERAVFVLREVFDVPYDEIAGAIGKTPAAVRKIANRARGHVTARRPRMQVSRTQQQQVVERFLAAVRGGTCRTSSMCSRPMWWPSPTAAASRRRSASRWWGALGWVGPSRPSPRPRRAQRSQRCGSTARPASGSTSTARSTPRSA
jgi:RNA polymerase sigma-70 factor (ECF subfamily)